MKRRIWPIVSVDREELAAKYAFRQGDFGRVGPFTVRVDVRTSNPNNGGTGHSRLAGILRSKERRKQRGATWNVLLARCGVQKNGWLARMLPGVVTLTRIAPSNGLDPHDGLRAALKGCVDGVADWLGLKSDRDPRVTWQYDQKRGKRGEYAVLIAIDPAHPRDPDLTPQKGCQEK